MNRIPLFKVNMSPEAKAAVAEVLDSLYVGQGPKVDAFELALQKELGFQRRPLALNSCTSALDLAYELCGIKEGSIVVSTPVTCTATNAPLANRGARILWADVDPRTGLISTSDAWNLCKEYDVAAIVAVDWAGASCDYQVLKGIGPPVIQDAAHRYLPGAFSDESKIGDHVCFPGSIQVITREGPRRISSIKPGDEVLTGESRFRRVKEVQVNHHRGEWIWLKVGQVKITCTPDHPIMIHRDGSDSWMKARDVRLGDSVYVATKECPRCHTCKIPVYGNVCEDCFLKANVADKKREKVQKARGGAREWSTCRLRHHFKHVEPWMLKYEQDGYRVIPLIYAIPDFLAIKDGKVYALEVESGTSVRMGKEHKYDRLGRFTYDEVRWITREKQRHGKRYMYSIIGDMARVPVAAVDKHDWLTPTKKGRRNIKVYNLEVEEDHTYFARGILVHNCHSYQAIKHLTCGDGGSIGVPRRDEKLAELMRWYGLDRKSSASFRCAQTAPVAGFKYHMNDIAAAIGLANLRLAVENVGKSQECVAHYQEVLSEIKAVSLPPPAPIRESAHWLYCVLVYDQDGFIRHLDSLGIDASPVHARNDKHPALRGWKWRRLPGVDEFCSREVAIPCGWWLTDEDKKRVVEAVRSWKP